MSLIFNTFYIKKIMGDIFYTFSKRNLPIPVRCADIICWKTSYCFCHSVQSSGSVKKHDSSEYLQKAFYLENVAPALDGTHILGDLPDPELILILRRFGMKGLDIEYLKKFNVRVSPDFTTLLFPFSSIENQFTAIQTMVWNKEDTTENITKSFIGFDDQALFGWSLVNSEYKELVVTSDPLDAIAVNQSTNIPAVSIPFVKSLPYIFSRKLLTLFNIFNKVIFWMKPDLHSFDIHKLLGLTLRKNGYFIWPGEFHNSIFCLQNGFDIKKILKKAYPLYDERLKHIDEFKDEIYKELFQEKVAGLKWKRFAPLNELLKGHRNGELTVFTGQTGTGKTTFMAEYSLDLCSQGLPTLWINLEIPHSRLLRTILCQFSNCSPEEVSQSFDFWIEKFQKIPMTILDFSNCFSLKEILNAMISAVRLSGIKHIIVDNLQFMMYMSETNSTLDFLRGQDKIYAEFRKFATERNCHVTIIIHPRKEAEFSELTVSSISGTSKATQEADNVLILQTTKSRQYLQVAKNRFDGTKGCLLLEFNKRTFSYAVKNVGLKTKPGTVDFPSLD